MQHASDIDSGIEAGLADVIACTSSISLVDGSSGRLLYRGYDIAELAEQSSFEEVAYLLWFGRLPGVVEFRAFLDGFSGSMKMPVETVMILRMFPHAATPMEVLRTAVSSLGHWDPDSGNTRLDACLRKAQRITERIPLIIAAHQRLRGGQEPLKPIAGRSIAFNFLYTLQGKEPHPDMVKAMDTALILHADHELNASTFAARVTAATMTDLYSAMTSAIAALKGPLHGGANAEVMKRCSSRSTSRTRPRSGSCRDSWKNRRSRVSVTGCTAARTRGPPSCAGRWRRSASSGAIAATTRWLWRWRR